MRARYYNSGSSRFIIENSYWVKIMIPLSLNLYTYCKNHPINMIDSSEHFAFLAPLIATV
ncbi:hypothetical protein [Pseudobacteroides sp.]|uniref:hypothetical protein n=1 Tax=Pseudobacteroides sp. TaxID=1968840 RepID=UPI0039C8FD83